MPSDIARCGEGFNGYIAEKDQAQKHGVSLATLRRWRDRKYGPQPVRIGRKYFYRDDASEQWLAALENAAAEPRRRSRR
jgi:predicted DNA-binding transcriptional regulator AlpA